MITDKEIYEFFEPEGCWHEYKAEDYCQHCGDKHLPCFCNDDE